jgi:hypothetical protein
VAAPDVHPEFVGRDEIRATIEQLPGRWDYAGQNAHRATIQVDGDTAVDRSYVSEPGQLRDGRPVAWADSGLSRWAMNLSCPLSTVQDNDRGDATK